MKQNKKRHFGVVAGLILFGLLRGAQPAFAVGAFTYLSGSSLPDITPGTADSWQTVDVSAYVPSGASGIIVMVIGTSTSALYGIRHADGSDTWMIAEETAKNDRTTWLASGINASREVEIYTADKLKY